MRTSICRAVLVVCLAAGLASQAAAQSRPLSTEDPETVPAGFVLVEGGFDFLNNALFPASGLKGNLVRLATFGLSVGVSSIAEFQIDGGIRNRLSIEAFDQTAPLAGLYTGNGTSTGSVQDLVFGGKVRFLAESPGRPSAAVRFATRLPNAGNESGLGTDTFDFALGVAFGKTVQSIRVVTNFGLLLAGDPVFANEQNRLFTYGVSVARAVAQGVELVGEVNGRVDTGDTTPTPGTESRGVFGVGGRITRGPVRLDAGFRFGLTDVDPTWGLTAGVTWVFKGFEVK